MTTHQQWVLKLDGVQEQSKWTMVYAQLNARGLTGLNVQHAWHCWYERWCQSIRFSFDRATTGTVLLVDGNLVQFRICGMILPFEQTATTLLNKLLWVAIILDHGLVVIVSGLLVKVGQCTCQDRATLLRYVPCKCLSCGTLSKWNEVGWIVSTKNTAIRPPRNGAQGRSTVKPQSDSSLTHTSEAKVSIVCRKCT